MSDNDATFSGSIPALYDRYMGHVTFAPYGADLARRLQDITAGTVLEIAAGTGIATRALVDTLPETVAIIATDLNQPMLDHAASKPGLARVTFRQADALALPFPNNTFDAVVCQFGVMFFPDRRAGFREALRVLKRGHRFIFSVWDALQFNPISDTIHQAVAARFPQDPPRFVSRIPFGYHDADTIRADLQAAGFVTVNMETVKLQSRRDSYRNMAIGMCQGSPLRGEIEARDPNGLQATTDAAAAALAACFGNGDIEAPMQAFVVTATV